MKLILLTLAALPLFANAFAADAFAADAFADESAAAVNGDTVYQSSYSVLPFVSYSPETSMMFGGMALHQFKPGGAGPETRSSSFIFSAMYTLNRQLMIEFTPNVILPQERWILDGRYEFSIFPESYWGVGSETEDHDELEIEYSSFDFRQSVLRKLGPDLFAGPKLRWNRVYDISVEEPENNTASDAGDNAVGETTLAGIGFSVRQDRRSSIATPAQGRYLELTAMFYPDISGATHPHSSWRMDARRYVDLSGDQSQVLAFHFRSQLTTGQLPFREYALLGGREIMRGYYEGRFRDSNSAQIQAEFRRHAWWRIGFAVFAAAGEVWNRFEDFHLNNPKFSAGAGLRFDLNPDDTTNLRIDYGISPHGGGLYITIGEAF